MPGTLARRLVADFATKLPSGWTARPECALFDTALARRIGYEPDVDLMLTSPRGDRVVV